MAGDKKSAPVGDALSDLKWLIAFLVVLWIVWFFTGGPDRYLKSKPFLKPPAAPGEQFNQYGPQP